MLENNNKRQGKENEENLKSIHVLRLNFITKITT